MQQSEIKNVTKEVVASFNSGIEAVGLLIEKGLELLDSYRREQEAVRGSLRDSLASVGSLRHKDFDGLMEGILTFQAEREGEIKSLIKNFLGRQRELAARLRRSLEAQIFEEVEKSKQGLSEMFEKAKLEILAFQKEQEKIRETFQGLETRKENITAREFKKAIQDLEGELFGLPFQTAKLERVGESY